MCCLQNEHFIQYFLCVNYVCTPVPLGRCKTLYKMNGIYDLLIVYKVLL